MDDVLINLLSSSNYIILNKTLIKKLGILEAVFLSELIDKYRYFIQQDLLLNYKGAKWYFFTKENLSHEVDISPKQQIAIVKKLKSLQLLETMSYGIPCKRYFSINFKNIYNLLQNDEIKRDNSEQSVVTKRNGINNNKYNNNKYNINKNIYSDTLSNQPIEGSNNQEDLQLKDQQIKIDSNQKDIQFKDQQIENINDHESDVIIDYLNNKTSSHYQKNETNRRLIRPKIKQYGLEIIKRIIDYKVNEWQNSEFSKYLRPRTLFSSKIEDYYNQLLQSQQKRQKEHKKWVDWRTV